MAVWRYYSYDYLTLQRVSELSLSGVGFNDPLQGIGAAKGTLKLPPITPPSTDLAVLPFTTEDGEPIYVESDGDPLAVEDTRPVAGWSRALKLKDAAEPNKRQLLIERNGQLKWCGPIVDAPFDDGPETIAISAASDTSWMAQRINDRKRTYNGDEFDIVRALITAMQGVTGGNIGLEVDSGLSGTTRSVVYERYELKTYAEILNLLAKMEDGFDYWIEPSWHPDTGALVKRLRLAKRRGRNYQQSGWVFRLGRNITSFKYPNDGTRQFTKVWATGSGSENSMMISSAVASNMLLPLASGGPDYPLRETVLSFKDEEDQATLDARARARRDVVAKPVQFFEITVNGDVAPEFGSYITGDSIRLEFPPYMTPYFPNGLITNQRIIDQDVTPGDDGGETVKLTLGEEPGG